MSIARLQPSLGDRLYQDRIVLFGGSPRTLNLLQMALIRSDNVLLVAARAEDAVRTHARRMRVEHRIKTDGTEWTGAVTVLVAVGRPDIEDQLVEEARFRCIPVYVADRPAVSDFTVLDFLDRRSSTLAARARPPVRMTS